jgi:futalosine hydrolase
MRILIVAATAQEVAPLIGKADARIEALYLPSHLSLGGHVVDVLATGVGMVATAMHCAGALARQHYDVAFNLGVCGSFEATLGPGAVVHVTSERLSELGAEDGDRFLPGEEIGLLREPLFVNGALTNAHPPANVALADLPQVRGITVNTVHGNERSIAEVMARCSPQVESMEGAAFFYTCLAHRLPFAEVRAVSNMVERRNRAAWRMAEAIDRLCASAHALIEAT